MLKSKDFYLMKVYDTNGKYLGVVEDISIDFYNAKIMGFKISPVALFRRNNYVKSESIISIEEVMIVKELEKFQGLKFKEIKYMDIIDKRNVMIGVLEDLIIEKAELSIKGLIISSGIFDRMFRGKEIIMLKYCILCEDYILYTGNESVRVKTLPHNIGGI